jgi:riboflavin synthase
MFTGIVAALGQVERVVEEGAGRRLILAWAHLAEPFQIGESVAVNGCCMTVVSAGDDWFEVQAGPETLLRTNLGRMVAGNPVNLERSLRAGDRIGGHFVQGHIDTTASLRERRALSEWEFLYFDIDPNWTPLMVPKGSIAVDGVSLTLVDVSASTFSVMLIPHTLSVTTLGLIARGDLVNIEVDILAKHVQRLISDRRFQSSD